MYGDIRNNNNNKKDFAKHKINIDFCDNTYSNYYWVKNNMKQKFLKNTDLIHLLIETAK